MSQIASTAPAMPEVARELANLIQRTNHSNPAREDVQRLRQFLRDHPEVWRALGETAERGIDAVVESFSLVPLVQESARCRAKTLRDDLGWRDASALERTLIDAVVMSWLYFNETMRALAALAANPVYPADMVANYDKRMDRAHRRYIQTTEALARVRRLSRRTPELLTDFTGKEDFKM